MTNYPYFSWMTALYSWVNNNKHVGCLADNTTRCGFDLCILWLFFHLTLGTIWGCIFSLSACALELTWKKTRQGFSFLWKHYAIKSGYLSNRFGSCTTYQCSAGRDCGLKKIYCKPHCPLLTTFFIPRLDWKRELYAWVLDKRQWKSVSVSKAAKEEERVEKTIGKGFSGKEKMLRAESSSVQSSLLPPYDVL